MKDSRVVYVIPIAALVALLVVSLLVWAGMLTGAWESLLATTPAVLVTIAVVTGIASGVILFGKEEEETPSEASHPDGAELMDRMGLRMQELAHRASIQLHVHGWGP